MKILSIDSEGSQLRFQPTPNGDVEVVISYAAVGNDVVAVIPKGELAKVAEFLKQQA